MAKRLSTENPNISSSVLTILRCSYFFGKFISSECKKKTKHTKKYKYDYKKGIPLTFEEYKRIKLLETLMDVDNHVFKQFPIELLRIISKYGNGNTQSCLICERDVLLYNITKMKHNKHDIIRYDKVELNKKEFVLLSDNVSLLCKRCCIVNDCKCLFCGSLSRDIQGFPYSMCSKCCTLTTVLNIPNVWNQPTALAILYGSNPRLLQFYSFHNYENS